MRIIAIEEHFSNAPYRQKVANNEARSFYITSRSAYLGHDIGKELDDLGESRLKHMDATGIDLQVLSFNGPVAPGFGGLPPLLAQIPMTVRLQLLAERFARLRRQNPDVAITGEWDAPALWQMGAPGAAP